MFLYSSWDRWSLLFSDLAWKALKQDFISLAWIHVKRCLRHTCLRRTLTKTHVTFYDSTFTWRDGWVRPSRPAASDFTNRKNRVGGGEGLKSCKGIFSMFYVCSSCFISVFSPSPQSTPDSHSPTHPLSRFYLFTSFQVMKTQTHRYPISKLCLERLNFIRGKKRLTFHPNPTHKNCSEVFFAVALTSMFGQTLFKRGKLACKRVYFLREAARIAFGDKDYY